MDKYYEAVDDKPREDLQLTAVSCLFLAAKSNLVEPFTLWDCVNILCKNKYSEI